MFEVLKELSNVVDVVVVVGAPNIRPLLKIGVEGAIIVYRYSTGECKVVIPFKELKNVEKILPKDWNCTIVSYSYDIYHTYGYVVARNINEVLIGVLKSIAKQGEEIGIPLAYTNSTTYLTLSKYWKVKDLSKDIKILRSRKRDEMLKDLVDLHNTIKKLVGKCKEEKQEIEKCLLINLINIFNNIKFEILTKSNDLITVRLAIDKVPYILDYKWSIPLSERVEDYILHIDNLIGRTLGNYFPKLCLDLVKIIKAQFQRQGLRVSIDVCGVGTEPCEYPSLSECLYENVVLDKGMALIIEIIADEIIYIPKLFIVRDKGVEVY